MKSNDYEEAVTSDFPHCANFVLTLFPILSSATTPDRRLSGQWWAYTFHLPSLWIA
jgi:hypothetical protein